MDKFLYTSIRYGKAMREKIKEDHVSAYSAMSSYFMLMSFVPFLMILLLLAKYLPFTTDDIMGILTANAIISDNSYLQIVLNEIFDHSSSTIVGVTVLTLLWASSKGLYAITKGLNSVYDCEETRNSLILRISAVFYTITLILMIVITLVLLVFGSSIYRYVLAHFPILAPVAGLLVRLKGFFSLFILTGFFLILYSFVPARRTTLKNELVGAVFASLGWSIFSFGFSIYVSRFSSYTTTYGSLGTILLFFLWLYIIMYILFLGAEINFFLSEQGKRRLRPIIR